MKGCGSGFFVRERESAQQESRSERGIGVLSERREKKNEIEVFILYKDNIILMDKQATVIWVFFCSKYIHIFTHLYIH